MSKKRAYDAGDPAVIRRGHQQERRGDDVFLAALKQALQSAATRLVIAKWVHDAHVFTAANPDETPMWMAYHEGRRSIGLDIRGALERADPALAAVLWQEDHARLRRDRDDDAAALVDALEEKTDA